jgi:hypothetical protein
MLTYLLQFFYNAAPDNFPIILDLKVMVAISYTVHARKDAKSMKTLQFEIQLYTNSSLWRW